MSNELASTPICRRPLHLLPFDVEHRFFLVKHCHDVKSIWPEYCVVGKIHHRLSSAILQTAKFTEVMPRLVAMRAKQYKAISSTHSLIYYKGSGPSGTILRASQITVSSAGVERENEPGSSSNVRSSQITCRYLKSIFVGL